MDIQALKPLIDLFSQAPLQELDVSDGAQTVKITRAARYALAQSETCPPPASPLPSPGGEQVPDALPPLTTTPTNAPVQAQDICAPMYGTLHLAPSPDAPPFVSIGDTLAVGQQVALIEAMKVFTPVKATANGRLEAILAEDGQEVEADQPLMRLS